MISRSTFKSMDELLDRTSSMRLAAVLYLEDVQPGKRFVASYSLNSVRRTRDTIDQVFTSLAMPRSKPFAATSQMPEFAIFSSVTDRVAFVARTEKTLVAAVGAALQGVHRERSAEGGYKPDNLILVGRNSDRNIGECSLVDAGKIMGANSTGCIRMLAQMGAKASVLIVQAKQS
jgi:hypothetical protein